MPVVIIKVLMTEIVHDSYIEIKINTFMKPDSSNHFFQELLSKDNSMPFITETTNIIIIIVVSRYP